ncbi:dihydrofolate reductase family protein [Candidatus Amarolinea dominans]|uniref:dihydrofolate reductase family protein n=1 Tax=Candidatus Amarolinea dominans TaxID=3140696 RepID=UPI001D448CEB|nr:dihydrofolate reductase [Anaerolineae bacterium]
MGNVILYIAISLDGFIARRDDDISWLTAFDDKDEDYGYAAFYASLGAVILGGKTYRQVLGFGTWPYPGKTTYVVTTQPLQNPPDANIKTFAGDVADLVAQIRQTTDQDIWLVGGGQLVTAFADQHLIDEYIITIIPLILGDGIPLFQGAVSEERLQLTGSQSYANGLMQLRYRRPA